MKRCPFCAEEIQAAAIVCRYCGRDLPAPPAPPTPTVTSTTRKASNGRTLLVVGVGILGLFTLASLLDTRPPRPSSHAQGTAAPAVPATPVTPQEPTYELELLSSRGYDEYGFSIVEGQVKNVSTDALRNVEVVANWYDKNGDFVKSDDTLVEFNPILPGQTSPFKSTTSSNPAMTNYTVEFKTLFGKTLVVKDSRKSR